MSSNLGGLLGVHSWQEEQLEQSARHSPNAAVGNRRLGVDVAGRAELRVERQG